ncbi:putative F-box associated domain, type 1 [Arabidopsis thaliana]
MRKRKFLSVFLVSFDYTTERFRRLHLPYQCNHNTASLSVVKEEKLSPFGVMTTRKYIKDIDMGDK